MIKSASVVAVAWIVSKHHYFGGVTNYMLWLKIESVYSHASDFMKLFLGIAVLMLAWQHAPNDNRKMLIFGRYVYSIHDLQNHTCQPNGDVSKLDKVANIPVWEHEKFMPEPSGRW